MAIDVRIKRAHAAPEAGDGYRVLIDHVWREIKKDIYAARDREHNNAVVLAELLR